MRTNPNEKAESMGLLSNTTPRPPNIITDPRNTTRISCIGPGKSIMKEKRNK